LPCATARCSTVAVWRASSRGSGPWTSSHGQPRQGDALDEQGADRDDEGHEDEQLALRGGHGQEEGGREGDHAAHPGPGEDQAGAEVAAAITVAGDEPEERSEGEDPHRSKKHHGEQDDQGQPDRGAQPERGGRHGLDDEVRLQPDDEEHGVLEEVLDRRPVEPFGHPGLGRLDHGSLVPEEDPADDDREDTRRVDDLGGQVGEPRGEEGQRRVGRRVGDGPPDPGQHPRDGQADDDAADGRREEADADLRQADRAGDREDGRAHDDESRGVVEERLPLEDGDNAPGEPDPAGHGGRGHGVGRRDDPAQGQGHGERDVQELPDDEGDPQGCEEHEPDGEQPDDPLVGTEVDERRADRRGIQQGREDPEEDHLGTDLDLGDGRDEGEDGADGDEEQRRRRAETPGRRGDEDDHRRDGQERQGSGHRPILARGPEASQRSAGRACACAESGATPRTRVTIAAAIIVAPTTHSPVFWLPVRSASQPVM
jgi:hypothetical protein